MINYNLSYNSQWCGMSVKTYTIYDMQGALNRFVGASSGEQFNRILSGYYCNGQSGIWLQVTTGEWVLNSECEITQKQQYSITAEYVQKMLNTIMANNKRIYENNLVCSRFASRLDESDRYKLAMLQERLTLRDTAIRLNANITDKKESYPKGYIECYNYLQQITGGVGVVVSTTAMIIIGAVVVASMAVAVFFAFRAWAIESEDDVKYSDDLTQTLLSKLTDEEYQQLKKETAGLITKAKLKGRFAGASGFAKWILIGVGCGFLYKSYKNRKQKGGFV